MTERRVDSTPPAAWTGRQCLALIGWSVCIVTGVVGVDSAVGFDANNGRGGLLLSLSLVIVVAAGVVAGSLIRPRGGFTDLLVISGVGVSAYIAAVVGQALADGQYSEQSGFGAVVISIPAFAVLVVTSAFGRRLRRRPGRERHRV